MFSLEIIAFMVFLVFLIGGIGVVGRGRLKSHGKRGAGKDARMWLARIHLTPVEQPAWADEAQANVLIQRLTRSGFRQYKAFEVDEIPSLQLLFLYHPKTGIIAEIASREKHGLSVSLSTLYKDGNLLTVTNASESASYHGGPDWEVIRCPGDDIGQLAEALKKAVKPGVRLPVQRIKIERLWEKKYNGRQTSGRSRQIPNSEQAGPAASAYRDQSLTTDHLTISNLSTLVAKVMLDQPELPPVRKLSKVVKSHFRKGPRPSKFKVKNGVMVFNLPGGSGAVTLLPHPVPDRDLALAVRDSVHWPEVSPAVRDHGAHLIVTVNMSRLSLVERHLILTRLTSAVAQASGARAVFWCNSGLLFDPSDLARRCRKTHKDALPLPVWVNFRVTENGQQGHNLRSRGLAAFNLMEIEMVDCDQPVGKMIEFAGVLAEYLIDNGPVIRHGDTFGPNHRTKVAVFHEPSQTDPGQTVYRVDL